MAGARLSRRDENSVQDLGAGREGGNPLPQRKRQEWGPAPPRKEFQKGPEPEEEEGRPRGKRQQAQGLRPRQGPRGSHPVNRRERQTAQPPGMPPRPASRPQGPGDWSQRARDPQLPRRTGPPEPEAEESPGAHIGRGRQVGDRRNRGRRPPRTAAKDQGKKHGEKDKRDSQALTPTPEPGTCRTPRRRKGRPGRRRQGDTPGGEYQPAPPPRHEQRGGRAAPRARNARESWASNKPDMDTPQGETPHGPRPRLTRETETRRPGQTNGARAAGESSSSRPRSGSWKRRASTTRRRWGVCRYSHPSRR